MDRQEQHYAKSSLYNTVSSIVLQFVVMLIGLILPKLYIVAYGSEVNGLVTSITQFISYFMIVEAGLASAGVNALYKPLAGKDTAKVSSVLTAIKKFYFQIGYIFSGLVFGLALLYPLFVSVEGFGYFDIAVLVFVLGLHGTIDFFTLSKYRALLTADQKYYVLANASIIAYIVNFVTVYIAIQKGLGITVVRTLALTLYIVRSILVNLYVWKRYRHLDQKAVPDSLALNKRWDAMILQILGLAQTSMPVIILTVFSKDLASVSVYAIYNLVASNIISLLFTVTNGVSASLGTVLALGDHQRFVKMYRIYEMFFLMATAIVYSCVLVMYIPFIKIYTSGITDFEYVYPMTAILFTLNGVMYNLKTPAGTLIGAAGVFKETKKGTIIQTVIAGGACVALTPFWGINGLLLGLILSNLYRDIELVLFMNKKVVKTSSFHSFKNMVLCLLVCVVMGLLGTYAEIDPNGYVEWAAHAVITLICATAISAVVFFLCNRQFFIRGIKQFIGFLERRWRK
ncbi:MAG: lipopolysaccharide biosynthesis protein [Lachnospiraceae bacterium]